MAKKKRNKNKKLKLAEKPRNPFAFDPIMRKGGSHEKTNKVKRQKDKSALKRELKKQLPFLWPEFLTPVLSKCSYNIIMSPIPVTITNGYNTVTT